MGRIAFSGLPRIMGFYLFIALISIAMQINQLKAQITERPFMVITESEYAAQQAKASAWPWSEMKEKAIYDALNYEYDYNASIELKGRRYLRTMASSNALAYILDELNKLDYVKRVEEDVYLAIKDLKEEKQYAVENDLDGHQENVQASSGVFLSYMMLDIMYNDLNPAKRIQMEEWLDYIVDHHKFSWLESYYAMQGIKELYHNGATETFKQIVDEYLDHWSKSITEDGVYPQGTGYAHGRGTYDLKIQKNAFMDIAEYQGIHKFYNNPQFIRLYEWIFSHSTSAFSTTFTFGDSEEAYVPNWQFAGFKAYKFSEDAAGYARNMFGGIRSSQLQGKLLHYIYIDQIVNEPKYPQSKIYPKGGAALFEKGENDIDNLSAFLWNTNKVEKTTHAHFDVNSINISAYGEHILRNSGYEGWQNPDGADGPIWNWIHNSAESGNVVLIDGENHQDRNGGGVTEGITGYNLEYASASSGNALPNGHHQRNFLMVQPSREAMGYYFLSDEIKALSPGAKFNVVLHPDSKTPTVITPKQSYNFLIEGCDYNPTKGVNIYIFHGNKSDDTELKEGYFAGLNDCSKYISKYLYSTFDTDNNGLGSVVTVLTPYYDISQMPVISEYIPEGAQSGVELNFGDVTDVIVSSTGYHMMSLGHDNASQAKLAYYRRDSESTLSFFVRQGSRFIDDRGVMFGFESNDPITILVDSDNSGNIITEGTDITLYKNYLTGVYVNGELYAESSKDNIVEFSLPAGQFDIELRLENAPKSNDATLVELNSDTGVMLQKFTPGLYDYDLVVPEGTEEVTLEAVANHPGATVEGDGHVPGSGIATIKVTAEDGATTQNYNVKIIQRPFESIISNPLDDSYIRSGDYASENYGDEPTIALKYTFDNTASTRREGMFKFSAEGTDVNETVSAVFRLFVRSLREPSRIGLFSIQNDWDENTITYSLAEQLITGNIAFTYYDIEMEDVGKYIEVDITDYVREQLENGPVFSFRLIPLSGDNFAVRAKESGEGERPELVVTRVDGIIINTPPQITEPAKATPPEIRLGESTVLSVMAIDPDGDELTYTWSKISGPGNVNISGTGNIVDATFNIAGTYSMGVAISDGTDTVNDACQVTVKEVAAPVIVEIAPTDDSYIRADIYENDNYGADGRMAIRYSSNPVSEYRREGLLKFSVEDVNPSDVQSAKLKVFINGVTEDNNFECYNIENRWQENTITWKLAESLVMDETPFTSGVVTEDDLDKFIEFDITQYVRTALSSGAIFSFRIIPVSGSSFSLRTKEYWEKEKRPALVLTTFPGGANTPPVIVERLKAEPDEIYLSEKTLLTLKATDADGDELSYTWDKVSGQGDITFIGEGDSIEASFSETGEYIIKVTVSDGQASVSDSCSVSVNAVNVSSTLPSDDSRILATSPDENYGDLGFIPIRAYQQSEAMYKFSLAGINREEIVSAVFRFNVKVVVTEAFVNFYGTSTNWNENTITWNEAQKLGVSSNSFASVLLQSDTFYEVDITNYAKSALETDSEVSFKMVSDDGGDVQVQTKEAGSAANYPYLILNLKNGSVKQIATE